MAKKEPTWLDGILGSELRDSQGEILDVAGADISDLEAGRGRWNDNHGVGYLNSLGRITYAKKIFKEEDCEDDRQRHYWEKIKAPYIYGKGYLYDDDEHMNAKACAAILRNIHKTDSPLKLKLSVEGGVLARGVRDPKILARTKIHSCAITFTPANHATLVEPLNLSKTAIDEPADLILIKSVMHLAEKDVPSFRMVQKAASAAKVARNIKQIQNTLKKMKEEELEKAGLKNAIAGAALATGMAAGSPAKAPTMNVQTANQPSAAHVHHVPDHSDLIAGLKSSNPQLWGIAQMESSSGKNLNHKTMNRGMHKGQTAGGPWGMMPKTAAYVMNISPKLQQKYPNLAEAISNVGSNHKHITEMLNKDPKIAYELASALHNHLKKVYRNDPNKILHAWHYGIKGTNKAAKSGEDLSRDAYVQKISNYLKELGNTRKPAAVQKALTAGYGGAGVPTGQTGGAVFQTESLEDGRPKFKYVTCPNCGAEQVYAKHQVKCRSEKCGKPFPLNTLMKLLA